jgi:enterochelin esterase-like enzyme
MLSFKSQSLTGTVTATAATVLVMLLLIPSVCAQSRVIEGLSSNSVTIDDGIKYAVYLPAEYDISERSYPVLYLFHGLGNDENAWIQYGEMKRLMDSLYETGSIAPMIVVMPYARNSWFIDDLNSDFPFESIFIGEFIDHIDSTYRTRPEKKFRALGGLSMGGYGALILAFKNPNLVSAIFSLSPGIWTDESIQSLSEDQYLRTFNELYTDNPDNRLTDHWQAHSIHRQASERRLSDLSKVKYYITSGDDDAGISEATAQLHIILKNRDVPHEYRVYDGGHTWEYWRKTFPEAVQFISDEFLRGVE